jgi:hypothetical protein
MMGRASADTPGSSCLDTAADLDMHDRTRRSGSDDDQCLSKVRLFRCSTRPPCDGCGLATPHLVGENQAPSHTPFSPVTTKSDRYARLGDGLRQSGRKAARMAWLWGEVVVSDPAPVLEVRLVLRTGSRAMKPAPGGGADVSKPASAGERKEFPYAPCRPCGPSITSVSSRACAGGPEPTPRIGD